MEAVVGFLNVAVLGSGEWDDGALGAPAGRDPEVLPEGRQCDDH